MVGLLRYTCIDVDSNPIDFFKTIIADKSLSLCRGLLSSFREKVKLKTSEKFVK